MSAAGGAAARAGQGTLRAVESHSPAVRVAHLTTTHDAFDTRVFQKECRSLAAAGYDVSIVAPSEQKGRRDEVDIRAVPRPASRFARATRTAWQVFRAGLAVRARVYHLHDPELLPHGILLKLLGKRVVYDAHESLPRDIRSKHYLPGPVRALLAAVADLLERAACMCLDAVVAATPGIARRFPPARTTLVRNFPLLSEFPAPGATPHAERRPVAVYLGGLNAIRGVREMVRAIARVDSAIGAELWLAGRFDPPALERELAGEPGWTRTRSLGWRSREEVVALLGRARVGLLVLHPVQNHVDSLPIKLFEYMAAGLPVVASRFAEWEPLLEGAATFVDPLDEAAIARALESLFTRPEEAERMGARGRAIVERECNWEREAESLLALYRRLAGTPRPVAGSAA